MGVTRKQRKAREIPTEHEEQVLVIDWCFGRLEDDERYPEVPEKADLIFAIPNGGYRSQSEAVKLKAEGVRKGVSDLFLPVAVFPYHGLFIELKRIKKGVVSDSQKDFLLQATENGYHALVCKGHMEAIVLIWEYLNGQIKNHAEEN